MTIKRSFVVFVPLFLLVCCAVVCRPSRAYAGMPNLNDPNSILGNKFPDRNTIDNRPGVQDNYYVEIAQAGSGIYLDAQSGGLVAYFTPGTTIFDVTIEDGQWGCGVDTGGGSSPATDTVFTFTPVGLSGGAPDYVGAKLAAGYSVNGATMGCGGYTVRLNDVGYAPTQVSNKNLLAVLIRFQWNGHIGGRINAFKISAQGYTGDPKSATPNATYVGAIAQEKFGAYPYAIQRRIPGSGTYNDNMSFYARISCTADITTPGRSISLSWNDADRGGAPEGATPYDSDVNYDINQYRNGALINTMPLDIPIALGGQNAKRSISFTNLGNGNFRITIDMGAYGSLVVYDSSNGTNLIGVSSGVGVQPGDVFAWSWNGVDRTNGIQLWSPFDTVDVLDTTCPPPNPPAPTCSISNIRRFSDGSTTILPNDRLAFTVSVTDGNGYQLGVNGPDWGNEFGGTDIRNYLVSNGQYARGPNINAKNFSANVTGIAYADGAPLNNAFYAPAGPRNNVIFNWGLVIPGKSWATVVCSGSFDVINPDPNAPSITINRNCTVPFTITIIVNDGDYATNGGSPLINYTVNGGANIQAITRSHTFAISGTASYTIAANTTGVNASPPGGYGSQYTQRNASFGPCGYDFTLTPSPQLPVVDDPEQPTTASFTSYINMSGTASRVNGAVNTEREFFFNRGGTYDATNGTLTTLPSGGSCDYMPWVTANGITLPATGSNNVLSTETRVARALGPCNTQVQWKAGDLICQRLTISPATGLVDASGNIIAGTTSGTVLRKNCLVVADRPYIKAYGGDVVAGSAFGDSCSAAPNADIVSFARQIAAGWVGGGSQFGVYATGNINGFASNALSAPLSPSSGTFANTTALGSTFGGRFGTNLCAQDFWSSKATSVGVTAGSPSLNTLSGQVQLTPNQVITAAGPISQKVAIYVDGDVTIGSDITTTTGTWATYEAIPSVYVIVRGNIYIRPNVTRIDGVYVAMPKSPATNTGTPSDGGRIFTCTDNGASPTLGALLGACRTNGLTINGAFTAKRVNFLRTRGTLRTATVAEASNSVNIAEVFNYTPEILMAIPAPASTLKVGSFDSVVSLPPSL